MGRVGEDVCCNAAKAVVFPNLDGMLRIHFRRLFSDGELFARFSIGLGTKILASGPGRSDSTLSNILNHIMELPARVGRVSEGFPDRQLIFISPDIARHYQSHTTRHTYDKTRRGPCVFPEPPIVYIEASIFELANLLTGYSRVSAFADFAKRSFDVRLIKATIQATSPVLSVSRLIKTALPTGIEEVLSWMTTAPDGSDVRCYLLIYNHEHQVIAQAGSPSIRALRIVLMRLITERQNLRRMFQWLYNVDISAQRGFLDYAAIEDIFNKSDRTLRNLKKYSSRSESLVDQLAKDCIEFSHPGEASSLHESLNRIFTRRNVKAKAIAFLRDDNEHTRTVNHRVAYNAGVMIMTTGDDFRHSNISAGAVGSGSKAENFSVVTQIRRDGNILLLSEELQKLVIAMRREAALPEQEVAAENIEKAVDAVREGKDGHAIAYFKSAGRWALEIAEKIGVAVAAGAIKGALGLSG